MTRAFLLSGGASLGAIQVGMLHARFERGIAPDLIVGTSAGAINGAFIASREPMQSIPVEQHKTGKGIGVALARELDQFVFVLCEWMSRGHGDRANPFCGRRDYPSNGSLPAPRGQASAALVYPRPSRHVRLARWRTQPAGASYHRRARDRVLGMPDGVVESAGGGVDTSKDAHHPSPRPRSTGPWRRCRAHVRALAT